MALPTTILPLKKTIKKVKEKKKEKEIEREKELAPAPIEIPKPTPVPISPAFATETGKIIKTIQQPSGKVFLEELRPTEAQQQGIAAPQGLTKEQQAIEAQNIRLQEVSRLLGQTGIITPEQRERAALEAPTPAFTTSLVGAAPDIISKGIIGGAALGFIKGAGAGIGGIAAGTGAGILTGLLTEIKQEETQAVSVEYSVKDARKALSAIINDMNASGDTIRNQYLFNYILAKIDRSESNLKMLEERDWLSKARLKLTTIQTFNDLERQGIINKFNAALLKPDPTKIINIEAGEIPESE